MGVTKRKGRTERRLRKRKDIIRKSSKEGRKREQRHEEEMVKEFRKVSK